LFSDSTGQPKYAQLFFYDPDEALRWWMYQNDGLDLGVMHTLQRLLIDHNKYCHLFLHTFQVLDHSPLSDVSLRILADLSTDLCRYNAPFVDKIAVLIPDDDSHGFNLQNVVLHGHNGQLNFIHDRHRAYIPLHYVLLFPHGWMDIWSSSNH
jgi:hypothetical protein